MTITTTITQLSATTSLAPQAPWAFPQLDPRTTSARSILMFLFRTLLGLISIVTTTTTAILPLAAADAPSLNPHLEPLRPWLGKTWRGQFKDSTPEKPTIDIARQERTLNGSAIRILHSINDGAYGGETIVTWDEKKQAVTYHYFTTAGFSTSGPMTFKDGTILTHETVSGSANGITEVRGTFRLQPDGAYHVKTEYLKNGEWTPGRETTYREDPSANVLLK
jgi:hypothetical protein